MKATLVDDKQNKKIKLLHVDDVPMICPFKNSMIIPGNLANSFSIVKGMCQSDCPHFEVNAIAIDKKVASLTCGGTDKQFELVI